MDTETRSSTCPTCWCASATSATHRRRLATRTTGINASARTLVYADDVLLSALINNNNGNASPLWFMVAPQEIDRIDVLYGPFSAMFPGNSYGAVAQITTRMPKHFEASLDVSGSTQHFSQ
ncbi:MAG: Plug domain-containing protein [Pararobbsia sp.]